MNEYTFKNLNEVETVAEPADGTTVMGFENGEPIQMPMSAIKNGGGVFILDKNAEDYSETDTAYGDKVKEALLSGKVIYAYGFSDSTTTTSPEGTIEYRGVLSFSVFEYTSGTYKLEVILSGSSSTKYVSFVCSGV